MKHLIYYCIAIILMSCKPSHQQKTNLQEGDIIFQNLNCGPFCDAIEAVTYGIDSLDFSHCGILAKDSENNWVVIEAISKGVSSTPLSVVLQRTEDSVVYIGRVNNDEVEIEKALQIARSKIGAAYDDVFDINNDKYYCSELTYEAYLNKNNQPIFKLYPMTYKEPQTDSFYGIWVDYFEDLNAPIPEGEPGLNPGSISRSSYLDFYTIDKAKL